MAHAPKNWRERLRRRRDGAAHWIERSIPPGARTLVGILLIVGGIFGFLPVLGFWMLPLGVIVISLDIAWLRGRLHRKKPPPVAGAGSSRYG